MLVVRVLGELELELDGVRLEPPTSRRARSLIGLLALEHRPHPRSRLAVRFWPDVLDESARTSLRSALAAIRRSLGPEADRYLVATRERVALAEDVGTDAGEFERLAAEDRLEEAVALWRGDLLAGLDDDWVLVARDEWAERAGAARATLAARAEAAGDLPSALVHARAMVALAPLGEEGQRTLIRLLARSGDRAAAIAAYNRYADRLRAELRVAPSAATRGLVEELRREDDAPVEERPAPATGRPPPTGTMTFLITDQVGSTAMLDALGDEGADRVRRAHFALLRDAALSHAGHEVKNLGDGMILVFGSSVDAAACAVAIQHAVARHSARGTTESFQVRIGLHVGEAVRDEDDYFGAAVVVAKRLCDIARGGQILASALVRSLIGARGDFAFEPVGDLALKGFAEPVGAFELGWERQGGPALPLPRELATDTAPLLGREDELGELEERWRGARETGAHVLLLAGEPGIGKTRLAAELCRRAQAEGATVLFGRSTEETLAPYQPFVDALGGYVAACPPAELLPQLGTRRRALARLVPELSEDGGAEDPAGERGAGERYVLFDAVASLLREVARRHPALLVLDDLHWADPPTLLLLRHVARSAGEVPLVVLGTCREQEMDPEGPLAAALADLRRGRLLSTVRLRGLGGDEVVQLIRERGSQLDDALARRVAERTEGNPFFVEEVVRHLESGLEGSVPESVQDVLLRRLRRLDEGTRSAVAAAAVLGGDFELAALERVTGQTTDECLDAMDRALAEGVVAEQAGAPGRYAFAHTLIRETVYEQLSAGRCARLHARAGEAVAGLYPDGHDERAAEIARHFRLAGDDERSYEYELRAARGAAGVQALDAAIAHYGAALEAAGRIGIVPASDERARRALFERGRLRHECGDFEASLADFGRALDAARAAGDRRLEADTLDSIGYAEKLFDSARAQAHHQAALAIAEDLGDVPLEVRILSRMSLLLSNQLDLAGAVDLGDRALARANEGGGEPEYILAIDALKLAALQLGDIDRLERLAAELEALERARGELWYLAWTLIEASFAPIARARWTPARERLDAALAVVDRVHNRPAAPLVHDALGWLERSRGDYGAALSAARTAVGLAPPGGASPFSAWVRATLGWCLLDLRAADDAVAVLEAGLHQSEVLADRVRTAGHLAWARTLAGDPAGAEMACAAADAALGEMRVPAEGAFLFGFGAIVDLARAHLAVGRGEPAEGLVRPLRESAARAGWHEATARAALVLGLCCEARGAETEARALFAEADELAARHGLSGVAWEARAARARLSPRAEEQRLHSEAAAIVARLADTAGHANGGAALSRAFHATSTVGRSTAFP